MRSAKSVGRSSALRRRRTTRSLSGSGRRRSGRVSRRVPLPGRGVGTAYGYGDAGMRVMRGMRHSLPPRDMRRREVMMKAEGAKASGFEEFRAGRRKAVSLRQAALVREREYEAGAGMPLVIEPAMEGVNLAQWAAGNVGQVEGQLL